MSRSITCNITLDTEGRITTRNLENTIYYSYNQEGQQTAYDGTEITYDAGGNPLNYRGYTFTWEKGRQLKSAVGNDKTLSYTYNANGIRTSKTVNGEIHNYLLEGTKILKETCLEPNGKTVKYVLNFLYDNEDSICGLTYNGTPYYFYKNLQGDVIVITDANGDVKATYSYDAWGVCTVTKDESDCNIATMNPFRYRGYYMDVDTGMYYLQSRYYDAEVGRFVNADDLEFVNFDVAILSNNIFVYCKNDCLNQSDPAGHGAFKAIGIQLSMNWGSIIVGFEILWDTSKWKPYLFFFIGGGSRNFLKDAEAALREDLFYCMKKIPKISMGTLNKFSKFGISLSFIAVFGNKFSSFPKDYTGWFTGISLSIRHIIISGAYGHAGKVKMGSFGLGVTSNVLNVSLSQTYYWQITKNFTLIKFFDPLKKSINNKIGWLSLFTWLII